MPIDADVDEENGAVGISMSVERIVWIALATIVAVIAAVVIYTTIGPGPGGPIGDPDTSQLVG